MKVTVTTPKRSPAERDYDLLVGFFLSRERCNRLGDQGDYDGLTSAQAAIRAMEALLRVAKRVRNKALKAELQKIGAL